MPLSKPECFSKALESATSAFELVSWRKMLMIPQGKLIADPLRAGLHVWGLTGFIYGTGPDLACGSQIAGSELSSGNSGEKPTRDCVREDTELFLWLECLSLIAWHDDVSTAMICSQVAWGRRVARRDCPWLDGDKWCIDFFWLHACLFIFWRVYYVFDWLQTTGRLSLRYIWFIFSMRSLMKFSIKCYK